MTSNPSTSIATISPLSILKAVWEHKYLCLILWLLMTSVAVYVVHRLPAVYRAETAILVESQRIPERYVSATVDPDLLDRLNALSAQILSASRLTGIIEKYDLYREERKRLDLEEILAKMRADITIKPDRVLVGHSTVFRVSFQGPNPVVVAQVANQIGTFFIDENLRQRETEAAGTSEFLESQLAQAKKRLEEQEAMLSQYKLSHNGELPQQENALLSSLGQVKVQLMGVQDALNRTQQNKTILEASLTSAQSAAESFKQMASAAPSEASAEASNTLGVTASVAQPQRTSDKLAAQLEALMIRYTPNHPEVRRVKAELQRALNAEALMSAATPEPARTETTETKSPAVAAKPVRPISPEVAQSLAANRDRIDSLKLQIATANKETSDLNKEREDILRNLASIEARIDKLPVREQQLAAVTRDYETTKAAYQSLLDKKLASDVAADMEKRQKAERFVPLEAARVPEKPIKPKRELLIAGGCLFSLALSMAVAIGLEFRKGVLLGEWELPDSVVVLGRIPVIVSPVGSPGRMSRRWALAFAVVTVLLTGTGVGVYLGWVKL